MKIFLVIASLFVFSFFFFITKDKKEESEKVETPLEKNVIVENLKKRALRKL